jgi:hypothetical protein
MKVGPTDIPADGDPLAAARRALGGVAGPGAGQGASPPIEGFGVRFGALLASHLAPPKPVTGAARGMAGRSVIDASLAARTDDPGARGDGVPIGGPGLAGGDDARPIAVAARTGDALDGDARNPHQRREPPPKGDASGPAKAEDETFVPGLDAVRGIDRRAASPAVPVTEDAGRAVALVPGEQVDPDEGADAPRQAVPAGRYALMQAAIMGETIRPAMEDARGARRDEAKALSDLTVTFGAGVGRADLRVSRKGDDIVIGFAGGGEAMVIRGGAIRGGPTLVFADGRKVPGDALLYEFVDGLDARAPDNGMPSGGLMA